MHANTNAMRSSTYIYPLFTEAHGLNPCASGWTSHDQETIMEYNAQQSQKEKNMEHDVEQSKNATSRRSFLRKGLAVQELSVPDFWLVDYQFSPKEEVAVSPREMLLFSGSWQPPKLSKPTYGNNTTNLAESRTKKFPEEAEAQSTPPPFKSSIWICHSISTIIPKMNSPTSHSSMHT